MSDEGEFSDENVTKVIDMGRSGATIAYDYFKDKISALKNGNNLRGLSSLSQKQTLINEVLDQSYEIVLNDGASGHCLAFDADVVSDLRSELGNQLAEKSRNQNVRGTVAVVYRVPELKDDQILKISLRSLDSEDTTTISQALVFNHAKVKYIELALIRRGNEIYSSLYWIFTKGRKADLKRA
ncbi:hypothetical protein Tco_1094202 [Tanacetum coccineum]|uniref:Uncharacterized protein n=1 Tax=Tanacetum coccineum TaxID=301880 RepID=A0ABQ5IG67_9ASTR